MLSGRGSSAYPPADRPPPPPGGGGGRHGGRCYQAEPPRRILRPTAAHLRRGKGDAMPFGTLWLPVLVSAAAVFVASSIAHMVLKYHKADYKGFADEEAIGEPMRKQNLAPGVYTLPYVSDPKMCKDPAVQARFTRGPVALVTVMRSGMPRMGKLLSLWFALCVLVSFTAAYVARHSLSLETDGLTAM